MLRVRVKSGYSSEPALGVRIGVGVGIRVRDSARVGVGAGVEVRSHEPPGHLRLQGQQLFQRPCLAQPPRVWIATPRTDATARRVDEHTIKGALPPFKPPGGLGQG